MSQNDCISKFLNLQGIFIDSKNYLETDDKIIIPISTEQTEQTCPCCGEKTSYVHDYRIQLIKDISFRHKPVFLRLKKRRYVCHHCGKRFYEHYNFIPKHYHLSNRLYENIIYELKSKCSCKNIAMNNFVSTSTVLRTLKLVAFSDKPSLPEVLGIDEFKADCGGEKYNVQITDIANRKTLDILPTRKKLYLHAYFYRYSRNERLKVKYLVIDMWSDYKSLSVLFPNAKVVVDKYHYVRQIYWALDAIRKRIQKKFYTEKRIRFKRLRYLLFKEYKELSMEDGIALQDMLQQSVDLENAWILKEQFYNILHSGKTPDINDLKRWLETAEEVGITEFQSCIKTMTRWRHYIAESFKVPYTNAYTEGKHNLIKALKRTAFGYRNFENMRKRILLCA